MRWIFYGRRIRRAESDQQPLQLNPNLQGGGVLAKYSQPPRPLDYVHTRRSSLHQRTSAHTQMKLCRWGDGKHAMCAPSEEGFHPPRARRSRASTTTCRRRRLSSSSTSTSSRVCLVFGECCHRDSEESGKALAVQHHEYAYDTCCLLQMCLMRVLCLVLLLQYYRCFRLVTALIASHDMLKNKSRWL